MPTQVQTREKSLEELSREYRLSSALLKLRIKAVKEELARVPRFGATWAEMELRRKNLEAMLRECRETSQYLEYYYTSEARSFDLNLSGMFIKPPET